MAQKPNGYQLNCQRSRVATSRSSLAGLAARASNDDEGGVDEQRAMQANGHPVRFRMQRDGEFAECDTRSMESRLQKSGRSCEG
ncbi:predicted protein [Uncinocarpus reesii 1704]|uniref:Uncharacterized protein n=1 Tax=Uncinocarpus reesii (strain UAMH 1704) TaxID=336963 RepID=C4K049_UNCRE|nr:uncharacterized protein UREG_07800 [Uncinocarpus reesii 1704]EEP82935.1 predicted protein [Uncinocarpus reesii 1704]